MKTSKHYKSDSMCSVLGCSNTRFDFFATCNHHTQERYPEIVSAKREMVEGDL